MLKNIRDVDIGPPHPGEILREDMLPRLEMGAAGLASRLEISSELVGEILGETRPVTADIAAKLAAVFGHSARFWLGLQMQHDVWAVRAAPHVA